MRKLTKHIFTGKDNETFCMGRVSWGSSFVAICAMAGATILTGGTVGVVELAVAFSTIAAGHGAAIKLKESTEPK
jgi:hypothetical protein